MKPTVTKNAKLNDFLPPHYPIYFDLCRHYSLLTVIAVVQGSYLLLSAINQNVSNNKSACFNFSLYRGNVLQLYYSQLKHVSSFNFQTYCQWWLPHPTPPPLYILEKSTNLIWGREEGQQSTYITICIPDIHRGRKGAWVAKDRNKSHYSNIYMAL